MKVDAHSHIIPKTFLDRALAMPGATKRKVGDQLQILDRDGNRIEFCDERWLAPDHLVRDLDAKGIDMRLISFSAPSLNPFPVAEHATLARQVNDELMAAAKARPDRVRAVVTLPWADPEAAVKELDRLHNAPEVCAVAVGSNASGESLADKKFDPVWARINTLKMPVIEHPMFPNFRDQLPDYGLSLLLGFYFDTQIMVTRMILNGVFARYPDFPFIVAHTGAGMLNIIPRLNRLHNTSEQVRANLKGKTFADYAKNLYYDTCVFYGSTIAEACKFAGPEKVMFGTDYPFVDQTLNHVDAPEVPEAAKVGIKGDNAARVFKLKQ
jgi:aminocarboxymuconate-semialdehyde decarboxylase